MPNIKNENCECNNTTCVECYPPLNGITTKNTYNNNQCPYNKIHIKEQEKQEEEIVDDGKYFIIKKKVIKTDG